MSPGNPGAEAIIPGGENADLMSLLPVALGTRIVLAQFGRQP